MNFAALQHSMFLQALGSAILNSLWQVFIIWIIYETINVSYKNASSAFKNKLSTVLFFISFGWFIISFITGLYTDENFSSITLNPGPIALAESPEGPAFSIQSILSYISSSLPYLSVSYIFLLIFLMFKLFSSYRYVYFISNRRLVSPPFELQHFASKVARQLNITKKISVWISNHIDVPATIGFLKPVILIPIASINSLSSHQLEAIILHELSHIKRNDYITNLFISVIETILFFNPFILLLAKTIKRERENCCDDFVIQYRYDPHSYASALLRLEQSRRSNLQLAIGAVSGKKQLLRRIKRITNTPVASRQFNYGQKLLALLFITSIICSVAWLSPQEKKKNISKPIAKDLKTFTKLTSQVQALPDESINIKKSSPAKIIIRKENLQKEQKLSVSQTDLLRGSKAEFALVNEKNDWDKIKLAELDDKEFKIDDASTTTPGIFFDQNVLKFVPLKLLENFSFQNLNVHININELNKNLKEAYKGINAMDWKKIQNDINESLSKLKANQLSRQEVSEFYEENLKHLLEIKHEKKEKSNLKTLSKELRKKIILVDPPQKLEIVGANRPLLKIKKWEEVKNALRSMGNGNNFYNYDFDSPLPKAGVNELPKNSCSKIISISGLKIILDNITHVFKESKNSFHYSISNKPGNENKQQKVIEIEVSEIP
ncbi:MAG TPA: M56 family metallopeptidase [Chitinophagaceae bacterium]|nr:M56 family metallopeptidase [Chitinophagaceae bacterium]